MGTRGRKIGVAAEQLYAKIWTVYGYARVSGRDQDLTAQIDALNAAGAAKIFSEKVSGAKSDRAELAKALKRLGEGDVLLVTRLEPYGLAILIGLLIVLPLVGAQLGIDLDVVSRAIAISTSAIIEVILHITGNI